MLTVITIVFSQKRVSWLGFSFLIIQAIFFFTHRNIELHDTKAGERDHSLRLDASIGVGYLVGQAFPNFSYSMGLSSLINNAKVYNQIYRITGNGLGLYFSSGIDFPIVDNFFLGMNAGLLLSGIDEIYVNGKSANNSQKENVSRLDGMVGFKFLF